MMVMMTPANVYTDTSTYRQPADIPAGIQIPAVETLCSLRYSAYAKKSTATLMLQFMLWDYTRDVMFISTPLM